MFQSMEFHCWVRLRSVRLSLFGVVEWSTFIDLPPFFAVKYLQQVSTLSGWRDSYPVNYRQTFAFCCFLSRLYLQFFSRSSYLIEEHIRVTKFWYSDNSDVLGAIFRPGTICPFDILCGLPIYPDSIPFGSSVVNQFSLVADYDPYDDSTYVSPWHPFPCRWTSSGYLFSPRCPIGFTPFRYQNRMLW